MKGEINIMSKKQLNDEIMEVIHLATMKGYSFTGDEFSNILKLERLDDYEISDTHFKLLSSIKEKIVKSSENAEQIKEQQDKEKEMESLAKKIRDSIR